MESSDLSHASMRDPDNNVLQVKHLSVTELTLSCTEETNKFLKQIASNDMLLFRIVSPCDCQS